MLQRLWQALLNWPPGALRFVAAALLTYPHATWVLCISPHVVGIIIFDDRAKKAYFYRRRIIHAETGWQLWIRIV